MNLSMHRPILSHEMIPHDQDRHKESSGQNALNPCDGCDSRDVCAVSNLACLAYKAYMANPKTSSSPDIWKGQPKDPSKKVFDYIWEGKTGRL